MNVADQERWKSEVLDQIFLALAASQPLEECLIFKGARVLNLRLGVGRQSKDLDSNLAQAFVEQCPNREAQRQFLEKEIAKAIRRYFESQDPVCYELTALRVRSHPPLAHPMGWDAFKIRINVTDLRKDVRGFPALEIDVASPEELLDSSVLPLNISGYEVCAYSLERIAGEKLRAFLSSLPTYRNKAKKRGEAVRAKDLYDLARIQNAHPLSDIAFWKIVGKEFEIACRSRYIDCQGIDTFKEDWAITQKTYEEATIPKDISFDEATKTLEQIVQFLMEQKIIPFHFPLPTTTPPLDK